MPTAEEIIRNSKSGAKIDTVTTVSETDYNFVYSSTLKKFVKILRNNLPESTSNLKTAKHTLLATLDNQTVFYIPSKPENVDVIANNGFLAEGETFDYTYNTDTHEVTLNEGVDVNSVLNIRGYSNDLSTKEQIIATSDNQTVFNYSGSPQSIEVIANNGYLSEGYDYIKSDGYITLTNGVDTGSLIDIRKF